MLQVAGFDAIVMSTKESHPKWTLCPNNCLQKGVSFQTTTK